ncbi:MAG TPA: MBL fold metallo-hydrolase [Desulfatiglandales bacterium]|nr:MBL fold metallo-hydrolase [Desulfatiglandales bacterium]
MWIKEPGPITDRIEFLGRKELCTYLLKGDTYALVGGAMAHVIPEVLTQLDDLKIDLERIRYLFLLHTHFDHIGMAPSLVQRWPWLKVAVSRVGAGVLKNQRALKLIQDYNNEVLKAENRLDLVEPLNLVDGGFPVHVALDDWMEFDLGKHIKINAIDVPGHSVCSIAIYCPREHALFTSDSIGSLTEEGIHTFGSSNYDDFQKSIDKLADLGAEIICLEHFGALTPPEGKEFCERVKKEAGDFRKKMTDAYSRNKNLEETVDELSEDCFGGLLKAGFLQEDLLRDILKRMVKFVNRIE